MGKIEKTNSQVRLEGENWKNEKPKVRLGQADLTTTIGAGEPTWARGQVRSEQVRQYIEN